MVIRNRGRLGAGTALISLHQVCEALVPVFIGIIVDRAVGPSDGGALLTWVAALAVLFTVLSMMYRFGARQLMLAIAREAHRLRLEIAEKVMHPRGIRTDRRIGDLLTVATGDTDNASYALDYVARIAGAVTATAVSATALLVIDVQLGLAVLIGTPVVLLALQLAAPVITRRVTEQQDLAGEATSLATDLVSGVRPLRGIGAQDVAARRYHEVSRRSLRAIVRATRTQGIYVAASSACGALLACGIAILAGWFALNGRITIGELITVIGLAQFLMEPVGMLALVPGWIAEARASANRVAAVLGADPVLPEATEELDTATLDLDVRALTYASLGGVDLRVRPGEFVGVVAHQSADGEALIKILSGRVGPQDYSGGVFLGGRAMQHVDPAHARRAMLVEPHHAMLFSGTIGANVGAGADEAEGVLAGAMSASAADQVLSAHPDGLEHRIAESGAGLSGGQRQRLALARALLARPPILVLHDPTTAVDAVTEHAIALGVRDLRHPQGADGQLSTVVVTSSPAMLAATDRIVVLDGGRVVAEGSHAELAATNADYNRAVLR